MKHSIRTEDDHAKEVFSGFWFGVYFRVFIMQSSEHIM